MYVGTKILLASMGYCRVGYFLFKKLDRAVTIQLVQTLIDSFNIYSEYE